VATEQTYQHTYWYPLVIEGLPKEYVLGAPLPDSVGVIVKGRGKDLLKLLLSDGAVAVDASGFKYSERFYDLKDAEVRIPDEGYKVAGFTRQEPLRIVVDRYSRKVLPITSALELVAAEGYFATNAKVHFEPSEVLIGGPEKLVNSLATALTQADTIRDLSTTTTVLVKIESASRLLTYTPTEIAATIPVEPLVQKEFDSIPVQVKGGQPKPGEKLDPKTIDIVVAGTGERIALLQSEEINVFVDYGEYLSQNTQLRPVVVHPPDVEIVSMSPEYFTFKTGY
jgi:hypothetical protein